MERVVVTGMGIICPIGQSTAEVLAAMLQPRSGIRPVTPEILAGDHTFVAGQVALDTATYWPAHQAAQLDRATQFALIAARQAIDDAQLMLTEDEALTAGVYWGTGLGGATSIEDTYQALYGEGGRRRVRPTAVVMGMANAAAGHISIAHGLRGPIMNSSTACSSSAMSIGEACRAIENGYADVIIAGGSEALITYGNLQAWDAMRALAHEDPVDAARSCKPFSADRTGIVLGEGAAAFVLESTDRARRRGAKIYAAIAGYGNASDATGLSKPEAAGQTRAMRAALHDAKLPATAVGYVNAHGTATHVGDVVETAAIRETFGAHANDLCVSSTKAIHGHLMGATGAVELVVSILALRAGVVPPTAHLDVPDPRCDLDFVANTAREVPLDVVMTNSFGFGGMNAVLVARRAG
jgi:3-oxoacyl-[acyl-carrier-protein] synthase II